MNALASTGTSQPGILAMMAMPLATPNVAPQAPAFVNMISLFLNTPDPGTFQPAPTANTPAGTLTAATPAQIADSMIRSMLGGGSTLSHNEDDSKKPAAPLDNTLMQSPLGTASLVSVASSSTPVAPLPVKQPRSTADLSTLAAMIAPVATTAAPAPLPNAPSSGAASSTLGGPTQLPGSAPMPAPLPKSATAFTAILTPMKETSAPVASTEAPRPAIATATATASAPTAVASSAAPQSSPAPNPPSAAAAPAIEKDSTGSPAAGANMQQGGDTPSQQDDTPGTSQHTTAPTAAKVKTTETRQDDSAAAPVPDRAIGVSTPTSFPEQAGTTTQSSAAPAAPAPVRDTAEALRTSEPNMPEAPQPRTGAAQEISIRISQPDATTVDLRVVERSGQVHVDVRSSDTDMQTSLRQNLGNLTSSLERAGYHSETFTPSSTLARAASSAQAGNQDDRQNSSQNRGGAGDFSGGRRQQQQQKRSSTWLEEMEDSK